MKLTDERIYEIFRISLDAWAKDQKVHLPFDLVSDAARAIEATGE